MTKHLERLMAALAVPVLSAAGCGTASPSEPTAQPPAATVTPRVPTGQQTPASTPAPPSTRRPAPTRTLVAGRYQPLWPFTGPDEVRAWQESYRSGGHQPWHLDAARTALAFTQGYLGFREIDRTVSAKIQGRHARVHVGFRSQEGPRPMVAAVVHLVRYGTGDDAPWEVVGTDDTTFSLTTPRYGTAVRSPMKVGGRITGVDESIRVQVRRPGTSAALGERCCVGAGGRDTPWSSTVAFHAPPGRTLTVVASTGGHIATVERFAITGVTTSP